MSRPNDIPALTKGIAPSEFIRKLAPAKNPRNGRFPGNSAKNRLLLTHIIQSGIYDASPFEKVYPGSKYRCIDYVIFDKWARKVWKDRLELIGPRIVGTRWLGSFGMPDASYRRLILHMLETREIWFSTFWKRDNVYRSVKFCLDCSDCFSAVKRKLFQPGMRNGAYSEFLPKTGDKLDVLIGTSWGAMMEEDQCRRKCPWQKCEGCLGAYWGKCDGPKRVEPFPKEERKQASTSRD